MMSEPCDAWKELDNVIARNTTQCYVRQDILVTAHGCDRGVRVSVRIEPEPGSSLKMARWTDTGSRNVHTMRELAKAINAACDFVEMVNPEWAASAHGITS
jgi:hypothetical protein